MLIRLATTSDVDGMMVFLVMFVRLMRDSGNLQWDEHYPNPEVFTRDIELAQLWVVEIDSQLAGVAALTTDQEPEYADVGWDISETAIVVHRLAVDPGFQGRGVSIALLEHAEAIALQRGIAQIRVDTNTQNRVTQRLLPKLGYRLVGEIGLKFRPSLRFFCYEKILPAIE
jgi:GNAT superfamily N-acetyltransferase